MFTLVKNVITGACSIQSALDVLKDDDKQQFLDNLENGIVSWVKVWIIRCLIELNIAVFTVKWIVKYQWVVMRYLCNGC